MGVFAALLKREWLEHRNSFFWAPAIVLLLMVLFALTIGAAGDNMQVQISTESGSVSEGGSSGGASAADLLFNLGAASDTELSYNINRLFGFLGTPFYWLLTVVSLFALIACLYDERRDHSVLFWKSMPVGNLTTVLSKIVFITWLAPLMTVVVMTLARVLVLLLAVSLFEDQSVQRLWGLSGTLLGLPELLAGFVLHGFWILPVYAWFLLIASAVPRTPILWAAGGPMIVVILERIFLNSWYLWDWIMLHLSPLALPWIASNELVYDPVGQFQHAALLTQPHLWIGVAVAVLFLAGAVHMRGHNNEL